VTDSVTGLIWLKQPDCLSLTSWADANNAAAALKNDDCGLGDNSRSGDWRLPTKDEWTATIARAVALGCAVPSPSLTNDAGTACYGDGATSSFAGVAAASGFYWSSTTYEVGPLGAWVAALGGSVVALAVKSNDLRVWPVRGGPR